MEYIAHKTKDTDEKQLLINHLTNTAKLAGIFAEVFNSKEEGERCGMLHDIGKYSEAFQKRINGDDIKVDHSSAGAVEAAQCEDIPAAFCIAGHHGGLPDRGGRTDCKNDGTLMGIIQRKGGESIEDYSAYKEQVSVPANKYPNKLISSSDDAFFYVHMLFSALVDADWLDTENFMNHGRVKRGIGQTHKMIAESLEKHVSGWLNPPKNSLNEKRCQILETLINKGEKEKGLYTLTVPTGGGKTVGSVAFALNHAICNSQQRIIYVIPYTSIIEQTQAVFEKIFGAENVVAHYANIEYSTDKNGLMNDVDSRRYLASENWDAPIILTTAVQFFESLFSNKPSNCRKIHNIAKSVVIFDEAQMLPVNYLRPCVWSITQLVKNYECTAVLCTATQPSLTKLVNDYMPQEYVVQELCSNSDYDNETNSTDNLFRRTSIINDGKLSDDELAERLNSESQVLCIVNSRKQAQIIFGKLKKSGAFHLSTTMCPIHRRDILNNIRQNLANGLECRLVSTSLIEAGVDVDFPCVYRSLAGLDSIIQAAGRCNREGKRTQSESIVHVFDSDTKIPRALEQNVCATRHVMDRFNDFTSPEAIECYFNFLFYTLKDNDALDTKRIMSKHINNMAFRTASKEFKIIEENTCTVYIPRYGGEELVKRLLCEGPSRELMRKLGQHAVSVYEKYFKALVIEGFIEEVMELENTAVLRCTNLYDENIGLALSSDGGEAIFL